MSIELVREVLADREASEIASREAKVIVTKALCDSARMSRHRNSDIAKCSKCGREFRGIVGASPCCSVNTTIVQTNV